MRTLAAAKASSDLVRVSLLSVLGSIDTAIATVRDRVEEERDIPRVSLAPVIAETAIFGMKMRSEIRDDR